MNLNRKTLHLHEVLLSVGEPASGRNSSFRTQTADCFDCQDPFKQTFAAFRTFIQSLAGAPWCTQKNYERNSSKFKGFKGFTEGYAI